MLFILVFKVILSGLQLINAGMALVLLFIHSKKQPSKNIKEPLKKSHRYFNIINNYNIYVYKLIYTYINLLIPQGNIILNTTVKNISIKW